jgi:hypothetical protein
MSSVYKEAPLYNVTATEIKKYYNIVYVYLLELSRSGKVSVKNKRATDNPAWAASEILYMALYGYTKKTKFSKAQRYIKWNRPPKSLDKRVLALMGKPFRADQEKKIEKVKQIAPTTAVEAVSQEHFSDILTETFMTSDDEVIHRMQVYIEDFDLHSSVDKDQLKNLIKTQMLIESAHDRMLKGEPTNLDIKSLSDQVKTYTTMLGLSKKDRVNLGSERSKGSVAELTIVYENTLNEYAGLEEDFLLDELNMLLDKYERINNDGERELNVKAFRVISGGFTIEEALEMTGRKRKYGLKKPHTSNS